MPCALSLNKSAKNIFMRFIMTMINSIQPINLNKTNSYISIIRPKMAMKQDTVSFSGLAQKSYKALTHTRSPKDAESLVKLLFSSQEHSLMRGGTQGVKKSWLGRVFDRLHQKINTSIEKSVVKDENVFINVIKDSNDKVVGGYSMIVEPDKFVSHVNYMVLAPELKGTRKGKQMFLDMAEKIANDTEKHNGFEVTWAVNGMRKSYDRMMSKIPHVKEKLPLSRYTEYSVFTKDLKEVINDVKSK